MICKPCRDAGKMNQIDNVDGAAWLHQGCEHPTTCPCLHKTGQWIVTDTVKPRP